MVFILTSTISLPLNIFRVFEANRYQFEPTKFQIISTNSEIRVYVARPIRYTYPIPPRPESTRKLYE